jgi:hypothetical protein
MIARVKDLPYIQSLNIGDTEKIPTLAEVFEVIGKKLRYEIELKAIPSLLKKLILDYGDISIYFFSSRKEVNLHLQARCKLQIYSLVQRRPTLLPI